MTPPKKPRKRSPRKKPAPRELTRWEKVGKFVGDHIITCVALIIVFVILGFIAVGKFSEHERLGALGSIPVVLGAAQKLEFEMRMRQQTQAIDGKIETKTNQQTDELKGHLGDGWGSSSGGSEVDKRLSEFAQWRQSGGQTEEDSEAQRNREARKQWQANKPG